MRASSNSTPASSKLDLTHRRRKGCCAAGSKVQEGGEQCAREVQGGERLSPRGYLCKEGESLSPRAYPPEAVRLSPRGYEAILQRLFPSLHLARLSPTRWLAKGSAQGAEG